MRRRPPLRTYSRKNYGQTYLQFPREPIITETVSNTVQQNINSQQVTTTNEENDSLDKSLDYGNFDTTFDRLLRSPRVQAALPLPDRKEDIFDISKSSAYSDDDLSRTDDKGNEKPKHRTKVDKKTVQKRKGKKKENIVRFTRNKVSAVNTLKKNKLETRDCFIRLTRLDDKNLLLPVENNTVMSSTPVCKLRKSVMHNVTISPINNTNMDSEKNRIAVLPRTLSQQFKIDECNDLVQVCNIELVTSSALLNVVSNIVPSETAHHVLKKQISSTFVEKSKEQDGSSQHINSHNTSITHKFNSLINKEGTVAGYKDIAVTMSIAQTSCSMFNDTDYEKYKSNAQHIPSNYLSVHDSSVEKNANTNDVQSSNSHSLFGNSTSVNEVSSQFLPAAKEQNKINHSNSLITFNAASISGTNKTVDIVTDEEEMVAKDGLYDVWADTESESIELNRIRNSLSTNHSTRKSSLKEGNSSINNNTTHLPTGLKSGKSEMKIFFEPRVLLTRLQDPIRVTKRRKRYRNCDLQLANVPEDQNETSKLRKSQISSRVQSNNKLDVESDAKLHTNSSLDKDVSAKENELFDVDQSTSEPRRTVYLKPGKFWARSLSILSNIHNTVNLNKLSVGKGKKWRSSVKDILDMQNKGVIQNCVRKQDERNVSPLHSGLQIRRSEPGHDKSEEFQTLSSSRFTRRISIRIVPDTNNDKWFEDKPTLLAYGLTSADSQTLLAGNARKDSLNNVANNLGILAETTAKAIVLQQCSQKDYIPFAKCFPDTYLDHCRKIGEGVYGEVFLYNNQEHISVIKIIPIEGSELVNGEPQKKFNEILSEIVIAKGLHNLRFNENYNTSGFVEVKSIKCMIGTYPLKLIELWNNYDEDKNSDNDSPTLFNENQLYIALELGNGGQDLEAFVFTTAEEAYAAFTQTALALAVAERHLEFEHRDLHWGNILIARTDEEFISYKFDNKEMFLPTKGVTVSIIDFTLSRMSYQGCYMYNDLALDPALFTAQGEYQFEIYRLMRDKIQNKWEKFEPYTNVLWLHYVLDKMITAVRYKRKNLKIHKSAMLKLKGLKDEILNYDSTADFITKSSKLTDIVCNDTTSVMLSISTNNLK